MRGDDRRQESMFSYVSLEQRVPESHPLRPLRGMVDQALVKLSPAFEGLYSRVGRPSIPPEKLLRALLLQVPGEVPAASSQVAGEDDGQGESTDHPRGLGSIAQPGQSQDPKEEADLRDGGPATTTAEPRRHEPVHQRRPEEFEGPRGFRQSEEADEADVHPRFVHPVGDCHRDQPQGHPRGEGH